MRALRLALFFVVGLLFGGAVTFAYAQQQLNGPARYGSSINFNYPDGINAPRRTGGPIYDFPDAPDGWGKMRDINKIKMGSHTFDVHGVRKFSPGTLAKMGVGLARKAGPIGIGLTLADLVWDEAQGWLIPGEDDGQPDPTLGGFTVIGGFSGGDVFPTRHCFDARKAVAEAFAGWWDPDKTALANKVGQAAPVTITCIVSDGPPVQTITYTKADASLTTVDRIRIRYTYNGNNQYAYMRYSGAEICESGQRLTVSGRCVNPTRPATDKELEDAIYVDLVGRGMGSDLARRLIEAGYTPTPDGHEADGPTTVPGETTTTTTTSPAGTTTITTNTTNNLTYNTNTTNNTTTITITQTTTTTTTNPDGTQTESTETKQPQPGEREEPEQYSLTYSPSSLPEVPDFYEQKYPDGFAGEWDGFKQRIDGSSLANFMRSLTNGIPSGGECPSWSLTFNFGAMGNFGTMVMQPPCIIWPFIKAVMILSALFVARRLVIGG
ncbi:hypothetical protein C662_11503 [Thauera sp. 28]|nr:hypothetical protein C662_11503 [Thauera sp. 28]